MKHRNSQVVSVVAAFGMMFVLVNGVVSEFTSVAIESQNTSDRNDYTATGLSTEVLALREEFLSAMKEIGMPESYIDLLLAICMQESGGRVED
ncbi:hypothetical protein KQJ29_32025, partial [Enterococcus sp. S181_ASV_20]|nr:hypothetical protein [Enterococcus sp. S181_ASV_20]